MIRPSASPGLGVAAVLAAMALVVLDAGIVNVALPTISASLDTSPAATVLVASAYQVALLMGLLPAAHIAGRTGSRSLFILGVMTFTASSVAAGASSDFVMLVVARFLQGLGGAAIMALGIPLLRTAMGRERLGSAIAWNALNVAICAAAGPAIGALILTVAHWPSLFFVNIPVGLFAVAAAFGLPNVPGRDQRLDPLGIAMHAVGAALAFIALQCLVGRAGLALGLGAAALTIYALLVRRDRARPAPLLAIDLLRTRPFRLAFAASICCFVATSAGQLALPFYLQRSFGADALSTGIVLSTWPLAVAITSPFANRLKAHMTTGAICALGAAMISTGAVAAALLTIGPVHLGLCAALCGMGFGLFQVPNNRVLFLAAPEERGEAAGGMQGTARLAGQTSGSILVSLLFGVSPAVVAPRLIFVGAAVFALAAAIISMRRAVIRGEGLAPCRA